MTQGKYIASVPKAAGSSWSAYTHLASLGGDGVAQLEERRTQDSMKPVT